MTTSQVFPVEAQCEDHREVCLGACNVHSGLKRPLPLGTCLSCSDVGKDVTAATLLVVVVHIVKLSTKYKNRGHLI